MHVRFPDNLATEHKATARQAIVPGSRPTFVAIGLTVAAVAVFAAFILELVLWRREGNAVSTATSMPDATVRVRAA